MWVKPTPTPRTKMFVDVPVDGAGLKLPGGMSNGRSVAVQSNNEFLSLACFSADMSTCKMLCVSFSSACRPCIHSRILKLVVFLLSISLCSRSTYFFGTVWSSCNECSLSLMICHSSSATRSPILTISAPISSCCVLSIKKSSPYLLYLRRVFLRPPDLVFVVMGIFDSVYSGTSVCSGFFQSSYAKEPSSEPISSVFSLSSILMFSLPSFFPWRLSHSPHMPIPPLDTHGTHQFSGDGT